MTAWSSAAGDTMVAGESLVTPPNRALPPPADSAAQAERARLARDLHDTVVQSLVGINALAAQVQTAIEAGETDRALRDVLVLREMVGYGLEEARRTILGLRPVALAGQDLPAALAAEVARQAGYAGLEHGFTVSGHPLPLAPAVEDGLLRIAQEALSNVRRHATANWVQVRLVYDSRAGRVALTVEDDGQGFDRRSPLAGQVFSGSVDPDAPALLGPYLDVREGDSEGYALDLTGYGLLGMQERARLLGGELHIAAGRGVGTILEVEMPASGNPGPPVPVQVPAGPPPAARIRVVVADDHPLARAGVRRLLAGHGEIEVVGEAADGGAALAEVAALRPDVLLLDLQLGEMDGVAVLDQLRAAAARGAKTPATVVLTTYDQDAMLLAAIRAGAHGYVLKQAEAPELARTVRAAARGETLLPPALTTRLLEGLTAAPAAPPGDLLTARERDILDLLAAGLGTKAMAARLGLKPGTIKSHLEHLYQKLGVVGRGRGAAVAAARARGLLAAAG